MSKVLCIYHANCADGLGAAWAVHKALGDQVEFVAAKYGDPLEFFIGNTTEQKQQDILIVDFSFPLATLKEMAQLCRSVLVLDHHKTAREDLAELGTHMTWDEWQHNPLIAEQHPISQDQVHIRNLAAIFDLNRSGAGLTWDYLCTRHRANPKDYADPSIAHHINEEFRSRSRPRIIDLIENRDLWGRGEGPSEEAQVFHAVLMSHDVTDLPTMFAKLDEWYCYADMVQNPGRGSSDQPWNETINEGRAILRAQHQAVGAAVAASRRTIKIGGHTVPCANVPPAMASEAGHLLCQGGPILRGIGEFTPIPDPQDNGWFPLFSATYYDGTDGKRHFSLRSLEGGADVGAIAKQVAEHFNWLTSERFQDFKYAWKGAWTGGGHVHAAGFDAPLGWEGE